VNLPIQYFDTSINRSRKSILEIFNRFHNNDALRPVAGEIMNICHRVMNEDNEENAQIALKVLIDIHRTFRPANEASLISYFEIVIKSFRNLPQSIRSHMMAAMSPSTATSPTPTQMLPIVPVVSTNVPTAVPGGSNTFIPPTALPRVNSTESLPVSTSAPTSVPGLQSVSDGVTGNNSNSSGAVLGLNAMAATTSGVTDRPEPVIASAVNASVTSATIAVTESKFGDTDVQMANTSSNSNTSTTATATSQSTQQLQQDESLKTENTKAKAPMIRGIESCKLAAEYPMLLMIFVNIPSYQKITHKALPSIVNSMMPMLDMAVQASPNMSDVMKEQYKNILTSQVSSTL